MRNGVHWSQCPRPHCRLAVKPDMRGRVLSKAHGGPHMLRSRCGLSHVKSTRRRAVPSRTEFTGRCGAVSVALIVLCEKPPHLIPLPRRQGQGNQTKPSQNLRDRLGVEIGDANWATDIGQVLRVWFDVQSLAHRCKKILDRDWAAGWPGLESLWTKPRGFAKRSNPGHPTRRTLHSCDLSAR